QFSNQDVINFFESRGVKLKRERGERIFPVSDSSATILNCLITELKNNNVEVKYNYDVKNISREGGNFCLSSKQEKILSENLIISTGGKSYPETGSTGDGYVFAKTLGHTVITAIPALVPLIVRNRNLNQLAGLSLKNVELNLISNSEVFAHEFGEMLFTHVGISGPIVLKMSKKVYIELTGGNRVTAYIDLKPKLNEATLRQRIITETALTPKKEYQSLLSTLLPKSLIPYAINETGIDRHQQSSTLNKQQIASLIKFLKYFEFKIDGVEPINNAIVTHGGISTDEIDRKTMESKIIPGLFFAGEIICLDGPTGGFNMQKAFSTGFVAGNSAKAKI
ncbi:MAG: aminoacetone oxidase family FAD-binding enzyme, partial [Candidatus Microgenomates bacterium]